MCLKRVKWTSPNPNTIAKHLLQPRFPPLLQYLCIFSHVSRSWIQHVFGGIDSKAMFQCHLKRTKGLKYAKGLGIHRTYPYLSVPQVLYDWTLQCPHFCWLCLSLSQKTPVDNTSGTKHFYCAFAGLHPRQKSLTPRVILVW